MQFRRQANKIQVLAYRGYDKVKRRAIVRMLGSFDRYTFELSDGLMDNLTDDEKEELTSYIEKLRQSYEERKRREAMSSAVEGMAEAGKLIESGMTFDVSRLDGQQATIVWQAIKALESELTNAGYPRPKRAYRKKAVPDFDPRQEVLPVD